MKKQMSINLDEQTFKDLSKLANMRRCSKNQVVIQLIRQAVGGSTSITADPFEWPDPLDGPDKP